MRVGVTGGIEPVPAAMLAPMGGFEQAIDVMFISVRGLVADERFDFLQRWRQTGQVEA